MGDYTFDVAVDWIKERPILFKGEMVRAILDGRKTQTRRLLKVQPLDVLPMNIPDSWVTLEQREPEPHGRHIKCRLGKVGDRLWVRETWQVDPAGEWGYCYKATGHNTVCGWDSHLWRPSIFMPRKASRITLEIVNVRCERLQDISSDDAWAEGIEFEIIDQSVSCRNYAVKDGWFNSWGLDDTPEFIYEPIETIAIRSYRSLWENINGAGSWDANPFVWAIEFKRTPQDGPK